MSRILEVIISTLVVGGTAPWWFKPSRDRLSSALSTKLYVPWWLKNNKKIELKIYGLWLDGKTAEAKVSLSQSVGDNSTGIKWRVHVVGNRRDLTIRLETLGHISGKGKWLASETDGRVKLVLSPEDAGTKWKVHVIDKKEDGQNIRLEALDNVGDKIWLGGDTADETDEIGLSLSETARDEWRVIIL